MTYYRDNKVRKYVRGYGFISFAKKFGSKHGKKLLNKGISTFKRIQNLSTKLNQSIYGKMLKKETSKQISDKTLPAAVDLAGSKIADKITSLKVKDNQEPK